MSAAPQRLSNIGLVLFSLPALPLAMLLLPMGAYLPPMYAQTSGLSLGVIGLIFMAARIFDVITDPIVGALSDRTRSRWGRRRPWIAGALPLLCLTVWALFYPPDGAGGLWLISMLFLATLATTAISIPHAAWSADVAGSYDERSRIQAAILMVTIIGSLLVLLLPALFEGDAEDPIRLRAQLTGALIIVVAPIAVALAFLTGREPPVPAQAVRQTAPHAAILAMLKRQPFLGRLLFADFAQGFAGGVLVGVLAFYAAAKGLPERASLLVLCFFISGLVFVPGWIWLSFRLGKARTIGWASVISIGLLAMLAFAPAGQLWPVVGAWIAFGSTMGVWIFLTKSIVSDLIDGEEKATGEPRAGVIFALFLLTQKLGGAVAVGLSYAALGWTGYQPGQPPTPEQATAIIALTVGPAAMGHVIMAAVAFGWSGDRREVPAPVQPAVA